MAGSIGHVGTLSFYPTKTITTGEGGAVVTSDDEIANRARLLRSHGETGKYYYELLGYNYRMTEFQAALGYSQLRRIEEIIRRKEAFARCSWRSCRILRVTLFNSHVQSHTLGMHGIYSRYS